MLQMLQRVNFLIMKQSLWPGPCYQALHVTLPRKSQFQLKTRMKAMLQYIEPQHQLIHE